MSKILIVEDEKNIRETLKDLLESQDYEVVEASDGLMGSIKVVKEKPDLILCDINMPEMDGFEMIEALMSCMEKDVLPPYIFLTARSDKSDIRKGMTFGADDYITKPFNSRELLDAIHSKLQKRRKEEITILSRERAKISSELHDNIQQILVGSLMGFDGVKSEISTLEPRIQSIFNSSIELLRQGINDLRNYSHHIGENQWIVDIENSLQLLSEQLEQTSGMKFKAVCSIEHPIDSNIQTELYRIAQECSNNILKHAKATESTFELFSNEDHIRLHIVDNGMGFDMNTVSLGSGLLNMEKRVAEINGKFKIDSTPGKGTSIKLLIENK